MNSFGDETPALIQTKLHRPRQGRDVVSRPHLIQRLNQGIDRKLTLISAQAGAGKSTLLAQWLEQCPQQSAWLSLDENDNNLMVFVSYLCAAIRTVFPGGCERALDLLNGPATPPPRIITTTLVNELIDLCNSDRSINENGIGTVGLILALDDYHVIKDPTIHQLVSELVAYLPQCVHLALSTRTDPPLPLAGLRARTAMTELRTNELQFTTEEAGKLLELTLGRKLSERTVTLLRDKTEGWVVGLRLAALSIHDLPDDADFAKRLKGTSSSFIADYMMSDVLSQQSSAHQDFLLRSSILNRFSAELCDAILLPEETTPSATTPGSPIPSQKILEELGSANLFLVPLDQEGRWFRYHHLFRDLLQHRLRSQYSPEEITALHNRASQWFEQNGLIDEALSHAFSAGDLDCAAGIVARHRYRLMDQARWQRLARYLDRFSQTYINQQPDLSMLKTWLIYHRGHYGQLPAALGQLATAVSQSELDSATARYLQAEASALASLLSYYSINAERTIAEANFAVENTPPEAWIIRILARLCLAAAHQMKGDLVLAHNTILGAADKEVVRSNRFKSTMLMSSCYIYWMAADLEGLLQVANQCVALFDFPGVAAIKGQVHYHMGCAHYQRNELTLAEEHFLAVLQQPHINYGDVFAHSAFGLSLVRIAQNRPEAAQEVAGSAVAFLLETNNITLLPVAQAFEAELALRKGRVVKADQWAAQFDSNPPLLAMTHLYQYQLTLVKTWLASGTPEKQQQARKLLGQLRHYAGSTHNKIVLIQVLALTAILHAAEGDERAALVELNRAVESADPGEIVRPFVDLGPPMTRLLQALRGRGTEPEYLRQHLDMISAAFDEPDSVPGRMSAQGESRPMAAVVEPLTVREMEVLELLAKRMTNKEVAQQLSVSPNTIKTHTVKIYDKLSVHGRRQAVDKAEEIGLLRPS